MRILRIHILLDTFFCGVPNLLACKEGGTKVVKNYFVAKIYLKMNRLCPP